jgi:hypothetical protein
MSLTKRLGLIVGAAASLSSAMAQSAMDQSRAYQNELFSDSARQVNKQGGGAFSVKVGGYEQVRFSLNSRDDNTLDNDMAWGFSNARTRINFSGNVFSEDWGYFIQFGLGDDTAVGTPPPAGGTNSGTTAIGPGLEDAFITYNMGNGWGMKVGQFKLPFLREELVGDTEQLAVDRSVTNSAFTQGRSQGLQFSYAQESFRFMGAFSDGLRTANTDYVSPAEADFALTARGEFMWSGAWSQADGGFTSWQNQNFFGMVGAAFHYQAGGNSFNTGEGTVGPGNPSSNPSDFDIWGVTADVTVKGNGWNAFGAFVYTSTDGGNPGVGVVPYPGTGTPGGANAPSMDDFGIVLQGGVFVDAQWELFGRVDMIFPDSSRTPAGSPVKFDDEMTTLTFGVNHYISPNSHAAKFTAQLQYFLDKQATGIAPASTLHGLLGSAEDPQWTITAQLQLVF